MGLTYWTSIHFIFLACLRLSLQEATPTEILPWLHEEFFVPGPVSSIGHLPEAEDVSTRTPAWLPHNEVQFPDESQTERNISSDVNHENSILVSEQLQTNISLLNKTLEENETVQSITPTYVLTDKHLTEVAIEEPPTVPLVMGSQLSTSQWSEISSEFSTSAFSTASLLALDTFYEPESSLDGSHYLLKESDVLPTIALSSSSSPGVSDVPLQPYIWDISPKTSIDLQTHEEEKTTETQSFMTQKMDDQDEFLATEMGPLVNSEMYSRKIIEDSTIQYRKETDEETFSLAMAENITDLSLISLGPTSPADASTWDCYHSGSEKCDFGGTQRPTAHEPDPTFHGYSLLSSPPIFISLHADWNTSVTDWGIAWEALVYGSVGLYGTVALLALLSIFCLVFRCPSGGFYFAVLHLLLISLGSSRAFALFYDAYGHQERLPVFTALLLHDLAFPCMTSSFSVVFLLLCSRCRLQHSSPVFPRLCIFASAAFLHFITAGGAVVVVDVFQQYPFLLLVSRGVYVVLTVVLSLSFFIFCCVARTQNTQIYDLKSSAPPAEYSSGCPFANLKDWSRATYIVLFSACFGILNAGLQLYAMLYALGYGGAIVFGPWPWWAFQLSSSLCEVGICLPLALIGGYPIFCANEIGRTNCWTQLFHLSPGNVAMKAPMLQNSKWASSQHEKLLICDTIVRSESEFFPLYTLVEKRLSNGEDLSLIYHSNKSLEVQGLSFQGSKTPSFISVQVDSDSTVDFRPPSPINLRRSIDEALFSESLIPKSLFHGTTLSSSLSLTVKSATPMEDCVFKEKASDRGLYRTSSCVEIETGMPIIQVAPTATMHDTPTSSSPGAWREEQSTASSLCKMSMDGSSLVLCSSPEPAVSSTSTYKGKQETGWQSKAEYHTLTPSSQEWLEVATQPGSTLSDHLIDVFGPIDALSVCSETIDL
ncbi:PREDICTED: proline-rich transmembrane protein 4 [Nanorana parkeri]|uniref:proline-rich transmembrane protein 4 n=1 Tax=Nanorana parkeri TaxID=125878 RepID=UPI000854700F|nr:PREDICTED: proline-rich transmembrane protein 4 [Nanorana parkeri]